MWADAIGAHLEAGRGLLRVIGHSDITSDCQAREMPVFQDLRRDGIPMLDLETGVVTPLLAIDFTHSPPGYDFSGRALDRTGGSRSPITAAHGRPRCG